jgi:hypothetical protein
VPNTVETVFKAVGWLEDVGYTTRGYSTVQTAGEEMMGDLNRRKGNDSRRRRRRGRRRVKSYNYVNLPSALDRIV